MPRTTKTSSAKSKVTKSNVVSQTEGGIPIINATVAQIRKVRQGGAVCDGSRKQLVRVPHVEERSRLYAETAEIIGERESFALPYHGGRMWKCEVKLFDNKGAVGDNGKDLKLKGNVNLDKSRRSSDPGKPASKSEKNSGNKKGSKGNSFTPLFRWYRGNLELATLPHILEDIVEVDAKMNAKKKWRDMSDDELDSSDEEWDDFLPTSSRGVMEISELTTSAWEDPNHPLPTITRTWISPDLQKFTSRKAALKHAEDLVQKDLLIDRVLHGIGSNGIRLRPVKPTRKEALDAGFARFVRDGLWVVGQEEMWIEKRRDILVKKHLKRLEVNSDEGGRAMESIDGSGEENALEEEENATSMKQQSKPHNNDTALAMTDANSQVGGKGNTEARGDRCKKLEVEVISPNLVGKEGSEDVVEEEEALSSVKEHLKSKQNAIAEFNQKPMTIDNRETPCRIDRIQTKKNTSVSKIVSATESEASSHDGSENYSPSAVEIIRSVDNGQLNSKAGKIGTGSRRQRNKIPPPMVPSTHYRLTPAQISKCYYACIDHYETVMRTVKARSLHHDLTDGFDVLRERGRGRYDMELPVFDTAEFSFLTDSKKSAWMPVVNKILGQDAALVHKGCFLSLPGSETQVYHQDGLHLNKKCQKPCHAVNVFIPLIDYDMTNGPTEFCLGTHYLGYENYVKDMVYTPCVIAGTPIIFDYRLGHRGLKNTSQSLRAVVYLTYSSVASGKEFRDSVNFSRKRYRKLGEFVERPLSREERANKRRKQKK